MTDLLLPSEAPALIYPSERVTCGHFGSSTPELVHHAAMLRAVNPAQIDRPCGTCNRELDPGQPAYYCSICRHPVCSRCAEQDGYAVASPQQEQADPGHPVLISWNIERRDFLIREIKEQAWNVQQGRCGQCGEALTDIAQTSIMKGAAGPMLMCDRPCAAQALGKETTIQPGSYPTDRIRIVADPRHGEPQDWLNVHYELSLPDESRERWSKADCRFAVELSADPHRWDFYGECIDCSVVSYGYQIRPHKWHDVGCFLRQRSHRPDEQPLTFNAQDLLSRLGSHPQDLPGIAVRYADPECLKYWGIQTPRRF